jgi:hypothetical protein
MQSVGKFLHYGTDTNGNYSLSVMRDSSVGAAKAYRLDARVRVPVGTKISLYITPL